ncbi:High mobility group protein DSP1 [Pseudolycoriella hygida]|uniref:High mobility group protein DSP1 n=1 Tax=Pseudolycoriella hygida TaxID=35572 RepID=A0A9Q0NGL6_9DIPT|nr:High mobility group protein DSP1 [Pseudolycoriella hygida]
MAEKDRTRNDSEMQNDVPPKMPPKEVVLGREKRRKQIKDPNVPKRSLTFCNDERTKLRALYPEYRVGDIAKKLRKKWSEIKPEIKN